MKIEPRHITEFQESLKTLLENSDPEWTDQLYRLMLMAMLAPLAESYEHQYGAKNFAEMNFLAMKARSLTNALLDQCGQFEKEKGL